MSSFTVRYVNAARIVLVAFITFIASIVHTMMGLVVAGLFPSVAATVGVFRRWALAEDHTWTIKETWLLFHRLWRDLADYLLTHLDRFQSYDTVKIYYDNGQQVVTNALQAFIGYALSKEAVVYRKADPKDYRLEQAADLMCTIELTALKFKAGESTETDRKMFGDWRSFKQNYFKALRRKQAE